jgi:2-oxoglutarate ferredoxin oxidoreductase subunit delta
MDMTEVPPVSEQTQETPTRKGPRGQVTIHATWCKGCTICVEFCPTNALAMHPSGRHPIVVAQEKCTACHFCDTHCPDLAIVVRKLS